MNKENAFEQFDELRRKDGGSGAYRPFFDNSIWPTTLEGLTKLQVRGIALIDNPEDDSLVLDKNSFYRQISPTMKDCFGFMAPKRLDFSKMTIAYLASSVESEDGPIKTYINSPEVGELVMELCQEEGIEIRQI